MTKFLKKVGVLALLALLIVLFYKCPIKLIFGIDCPGCGFTRSFFALFRLDFKASFRYHPMGIPMLIESVYYIFRDEIRKFVRIPEMVENVIGITTVVLIFAVWIIRLIF